MYIYCAEYGSRRNRQFKIVNFKLPIIIINSINSKSSNIVVNCQIKIVNFCLLVMTVNLKLSIIDRLPHSGNVILQSFKTAKGLIVTIKRVYTIQYTYTYCILSKIGKLLQNYFQSVRLSLKLWFLTKRWFENFVRPFLAKNFTLNSGILFVFDTGILPRIYPLPPKY